MYKQTQVQPHTVCMYTKNKCGFLLNSLVCSLKKNKNQSATLASDSDTCYTAQLLNSAICDSTFCKNLKSQVFFFFLKLKAVRPQRCGLQSSQHQNQKKALANMLYFHQSSAQSTTSSMPLNQTALLGPKSQPQVWIHSKWLQKALLQESQVIHRCRLKKKTQLLCNAMQHLHQTCQSLCWFSKAPKQNWHCISGEEPFVTLQLSNSKHLVF